MLGVCRGHQLICALNNAKLYQDIYMETGEGHSGKHGLYFLDPSSPIMNLFPNGVNSMHHQGVKKGIFNLKIVAVHNSVVEVAEGFNILSVQFHPEFMGASSIPFFNYIKRWVEKPVENLVVNMPRKNPVRDIPVLDIEEENNMWEERDEEDHNEDEENN